MNQTIDKSEHTFDSYERIKFGQLAAYGSGGIVPIALFNIAGILVGLMGNISLGLSAFWLGVILIIPRLWDAVSDPIVGHLSDNARTRWGRRRPFILVGGILVAIFFVMLWWIPKGEMVRAWFPTESGFQWFQLGYILFALLLFFTACTIFEIPHGALGMEMTSDPHERTRLFSAKSFVGNLFAMSTPWLFALANMPFFKGPGGNEADGMRYVSLMVAAILIPLTIWWFFSLKEPGFKRVTTQKKTPFWQDMKHAMSNRNFIMLTLTIFTLAMGFNFVNLLGSYIPIFYVFGGDKVAGAYLLGINGTVWAVTGLLAVFPLNWISPKIGKRKTLMVAILLMATAQLSKIVCYNPTYPYLIIIPTMLLSAGMLFFFTLGSSMVGDICDEDDLKTGVRTEGSFYSIFWWFIKMGTALASFVAGALIVFTMFDQAQVTKVDSIEGGVNEMRVMLKPLLEKEPITQGEDELEKAKTLGFSTLDDMQDYLLYLRREIDKPLRKDDESHGIHRKLFFEEVEGKLKTATTNLSEMTKGMSQTHSDIKSDSALWVYQQVSAFALLFRLEKTKIAAFELAQHLEKKSSDSKNSMEHYQMVMDSIVRAGSRLSTIDPFTSFQEMDLELGRVEASIPTLKRQTPYTLLMMRVVEIGLPILLSLFSMFFIVRYTLTEQRTLEIKELLKQRNLEQIS